MARYWSCLYANDRRKHRHRCRICDRIVNVDESVVQWRMKTGRTYVAHQNCVDAPHPDSTAANPWTWMDSIRSWAK